MDVPPSLRAWFLAHAVIDLALALPLFVAPEALLHRLGWTCVDPVATRVAAAALLAIGGQSFRSRGAGAETYRALLGLDIIWSVAAAIAVLIGIGDGAPSAAWALLCLFIALAGVWIHHAIRFRQHERAPADDPLN